LDEGIHRSDESGGDDVGGDDDNNGGNDSVDGGTYGVGGNQRGGAMSWESNYYATQCTHYGGRLGISQQRSHLDRLIDLSSNGDYSSRHDNYSQGYHNLEGHMHELRLTSNIMVWDIGMTTNHNLRYL